MATVHQCPLCSLCWLRISLQRLDVHTFKKEESLCGHSKNLMEHREKQSGITSNDQSTKENASSRKDRLRV